MWLVVEKGIRGEICHSVNSYAIALIINIWKIIIKIRNHHILSIGV